MQTGIAISLLWLIATAVSFGYGWHRLGDRVVAMAVSEAESTHETHVAYRRWVTRRGGVYVEASAATPPDPLLAGRVRERDVVTPSGRRLTLIGPFSLARLVMAESGGADMPVAHVTSLAPLREENRPDAWEARALQQLRAGETEAIHDLTVLGGREVLRYMRPMQVTEECLRCHAAQGYRVGERRGGTSVTVPLQPIRERVGAEERFLALAHLGAGGGGLLLIGLFSARLRRAEGALIASRDEAMNEKERAERSLRELQAAQQQVMRSERMAAVGRLAAGVAHEVNNPLMGLIGYVGQARRKAEEPGAVTDLLDRADREILRIQRIVKNMLGFARRPAEPAPQGRCEVAEIVGAALSLAGADLRAQGIAVETGDLDRLPPVACSGDDLEQVVLNLVINARDALVESGREPRRIAFRGREEGGTVELAVHDSGDGIPESMRSKVFDPFYSTKPVGKGTGLGLTVCYQLVERAGGRIDIGTSDLGGAVFTLRLPVAA